MVKLRVITNSEMKCRRRCPREHYLSYVLGYRPVVDSEAMRFGTRWHLGMEAWWLGHGVEAAIAVATDGVEDPYEAAKLTVLLRGYDARWSSESFDVVGVEQEFRAPLVNPETGAASRTFELGGKVDVLIRDGIVEHKSSSQDVGVGSVYWQKLAMDSQISAYFAGARALGVEPSRCVYDVVKKPQIRPYKATPTESRKYTKDGRLYANQRDEDESPDDFALRLAEDIVASPDKYYQRGEVIRLEHEEQQYAVDVWQLARAMRDDVRLNAHVRNTDACERYGSMCGFFPVCSGSGSLEDQSRYMRVENVHQELSIEAAE